MTSHCLNVTPNLLRSVLLISLVSGQIFVRLILRFCLVWFWVFVSDNCRVFLQLQTLGIESYIFVEKFFIIVDRVFLFAETVSITNYIWTKNYDMYLYCNNSKDRWKHYVCLQSIKKPAVVCLQ